VLEIAQAEGAAFGDGERRTQRLGMVAEASCHIPGRLQMPVGAALAAEAEFVDRASLADRGDHVLQHPLARRGVEHVAGRERGESEPACRFVEPVQSQRVARATMLGQADMTALPERVRHPAQCLWIARIGNAGDQRADQSLGSVGDILPVKEASPFLTLLRIGASFAECQQAGEARPGRAVFGPDQH